MWIRTCTRMHHVKWSIKIRNSLLDHNSKICSQIPEILPLRSTTYAAAIKLLEAYRSVLWNISWKHLGSEITGEKNLGVQVLQEILSTTDLPDSRQLYYSLSKVDQIVDGWTHPSWFINTYILSSMQFIFTRHLPKFHKNASMVFVWVVYSILRSSSRCITIASLPTYRNSYKIYTVLKTRDKLRFKWVQVSYLYLYFICDVFILDKGGCHCLGELLPLPKFAKGCTQPIAIHVNNTHWSDHSSEVWTL